MRKWLDKAWAKAAAFVLTLVLGGLTVLGGIGIGILVSYNVFLDDGAYLRGRPCIRSSATTVSAWPTTISAPSWTA